MSPPVGACGACGAAGVCGSGAWTPLSESGCVIFVIIDDAYITYDANGISAATNRGSGSNVGQSNVALRPARVANAFGAGLNGARYDGTAKALAGTVAEDLSSTSAITIMFGGTIHAAASGSYVAMASNASGNGRTEAAWKTSAAGGYALHQPGAAPNASRYNTAIAPGTKAYDISTHDCALAGSEIATIRRNGVSVAGAYVANTDTTGPFYNAMSFALGARNSTGTVPFYGDMRFWCLWDHVLDSTAIANAEAWAATQLGL